MLPYGALWKLDQVLHPPPAPRQRTPALRRRRALLLGALACLAALLFMVPYYGSHIRRHRTRLALEAAGTAARPRALAEVVAAHVEGVEVLTAWRDARVAAAGGGGGGVGSLTSSPTTSGSPATATEARSLEAVKCTEAWDRAMYLTLPAHLMVNPATGLPLVVDNRAARDLAGAAAARGKDGRLLWGEEEESTAPLTAQPEAGR